MLGDMCEVSQTGRQANLCTLNHKPRQGTGIDSRVFCARVFHRPTWQGWVCRSRVSQAARGFLLFGLLNGGYMGRHYSLEEGTLHVTGFLHLKS